MTQKLIVKRLSHLRRINPMAVFTEDGRPLPCQTKVVIESEAGKAPVLVVTFLLDEEYITVSDDGE